MDTKRRIGVSFAAVDINVNVRLSFSAPSLNEPAARTRRATNNRTGRRRRRGDVVFLPRPKNGGCGVIVVVVHDVVLR